MPKEMDFFIFLLEQYAYYKKITADKIFAELEKLNLIKYVYDMYEIYHIEDLQNAFDDIDRIMLESKVNIN